MSTLPSIDLPPVISDLVTQQAFDQYTVSGPAREFESSLRALDVEQLFPAGIKDQDQAMCCLSGLWLLHNFLDQSHEISQEIHSREGSFWHGIMHRQEGDFWNSKYWYRKVGNHPVFESFPGGWDPEDFVDQCESAQGASGAEAQAVQQTAVAEWKALFEYCFKQATG